MSVTVKLGNVRLNLPRSRIIRLLLGLALILGGLLGFLPVLGFWMIPLGLLVLSVDLAIARRWRERLEAWLEKKRESRGGDRPEAREKEKTDAGC